MREALDDVQGGGANHWRGVMMTWKRRLVGILTLRYITTSHLALHMGRCVYT